MMAMNLMEDQGRLGRRWTQESGQGHGQEQGSRPETTRGQNSDSFTHKKPDF